MPDVNKQEQELSLADSFSKQLRNISGGFSDFGSGIESALRISSGVNRPVISRNEIMQLERIFSLKYPQWNRAELQKYLLTIAQIAPKLFYSPYAIEEILKKAFNYGGLEPGMLLQYANMTRGL